MKGAVCCWFTAIADVTVGPDEIQAFTLGAVTVMK